ncbi:uncharacterized protein SPAPADRAFT_67140 [Spathaspora passalidarum NRRL Y-27907]|uniref:Uncharacterized protein n=1 Tax=Spathaspora passalidarum (strain NRRL Y-27907 / 11-Y1) TaxID=619300 RepID=G3ANK7_SPAPN|nr:uncharacterized protein SPAPADRAFT_67140 [Spathaspora passalidarum NRRL Y-27907]EGW32536.1 hypothetical protein SPAPADRAFT_67140 [Spathaspora passalidarum NRRL Y-27907]
MQMKRVLMYLMKCEVPTAEDIFGPYPFSADIEQYNRYDFVKVNNDEEIMIDLIHRSRTIYNVLYLIKLNEKDQYTYKLKDEPWDKDNGDFSASFIREYLEYYKEEESNKELLDNIISFYIPIDLNFQVPDWIDRTWFDIIPIENDIELMKHEVRIADGKRQHYLQLTNEGILILRQTMKSFDDIQVFEFSSQNIQKVMDIIKMGILERLDCMVLSNCDKCLRSPVLSSIFKNMDKREVSQYFPTPVVYEEKLVTPFYVSDIELFNSLKTKANIDIDESIFEFIVLKENDVKREAAQRRRMDWYMEYYVHLTERGKLRLGRVYRGERIFDFNNENLEIIIQTIKSDYDRRVSALPKTVLMSSKAISTSKQV